MATHVSSVAGKHDRSLNKLAFHVFAALAEFKRNLIRDGSAPLLV
jgi:hypothetical protein